MNRYHVRFTVPAIYLVEIRAEDEDRARQMIAELGIFPAPFEYGQPQICCVRLVSGEPLKPSAPRSYRRR